MAKLNITGLVVLSAALIMSPGVFNMPQLGAYPDAKTVPADPEFSAKSLTYPETQTSPVKIEVAGNAPCNPEEEVCNK